VRSNNEDLPLLDACRGIFGVIDGVGGHAAGEVAAVTARDVILQRLARPLGSPAERVREAIAIANNEIFRQAEGAPDLRGMTCVITLALVADGRVTIGHVGDSRLYKIRPDGIRKLTHDHSPVGEREDARQLSEAEAMRHPRRHEVFRDVGSTYRDKDDEDFVEVIEEPLEQDSALLLCTDGLTDMVPAALIARTVHRYAGDPDQVADALVASANAAGGKDNVTVVYAEGPDFARAMHSGSNGPAAAGAVPLAPQVESAPDDDTRAADASPAPRPGWLSRLAHAVLGSRTTWFAVGALAGVVGALLLAWRADTTETATPPRTVVANAADPGGFTRISDAIAAARPGDTVLVEPGIYREHVVVRDGIEVAARRPGTVTVRRPPGSPGEATGITASGYVNTRVFGLRVESTPDEPLGVGIRVLGQGIALVAMELVGPMTIGVEVGPGGAVGMDGNVIEVGGTALAAGRGAHVSATRNVFLRAGARARTPVILADSAEAVLNRNVFAGFGADIVKGAGPARLKEIAGANIILAYPAAPAR
jgi:serine/threonine protein phosphatase PrpC